ncbi:hypothetical protein [Rhodopirellula sp. SWK7]|uniref:hypothetical protein n=1 Tax=Rhodopirellula sp. SWK7 TaxID=595460 RepID=UPI000344BB8A|nr:hypothetical protein [Rhodopirellula sp. SWK7]
MVNETKWPQLQPGKPACYRIVVEGSLDDQWSGRLGGMQIVASSSEVQSPVTTLSGQVQDQAALMGVLNSLYQLRYKILSVNCEPCDGPNENS